MSEEDAVLQPNIRESSIRGPYITGRRKPDRPAAVPDDRGNYCCARSLQTSIPTRILHRTRRLLARTRGGCTQRSRSCARDKKLEALRLKSSKAPCTRPNGECPLTMMRCTLPSSQSARTSCVYSGFSQSLARQHRRADPRSSTLAHLRLKRCRCWLFEGSECGALRATMLPRCEDRQEESK